MTVQDKYNNLRLGEEGEGWGGGAWVIRKIQLCWPVLGQASHFHWPTESQSDSKGRGGGEPGPFLPPVTDDPKTKQKSHSEMAISLSFWFDSCSVGGGGRWNNEVGCHDTMGSSAHINKAQHHCRGPLHRHDVLDEGFIVDTAVLIFLSLHELIDLSLSHLLSQCTQDDTQLSAHHCAVALLVKDTQTLNVVLKADLGGVDDGLEHGQEALEIYSLLDHVVSGWHTEHLGHLLVGGVLSQGAHDVGHLVVRHLVVAHSVEQAESLSVVIHLVWGEVELHGGQVDSSLLGLLWLGCRLWCLGCGCSGLGGGLSSVLLGCHFIVG